MDNEKRSSFTGKLGFVLAAAGSAVGLGNIWRFPYLAAKHGGGIFLLTYLILTVTFGFTLLIAEIAIGRKTGLSAVGAFGALKKKFGFIGYIESVVPIIILPYYCVIGGWVVKYFVTTLSESISYVLSKFSGQAPTAASAVDGFFESFIQQPFEPLIWFAIYLVATAIVVFMGVEKGIEKVSKIMMPILITLSVFIAGYCLFLPGALEGVKYYLLPDFSHFSFNTVLAAMGQLFYSMSLAMGIMITYGSYMKKDVNLESSVRQIELFDTGIAFLAGLMIIPSVFVFSGGDRSALGKGPGLMFVTLPKVFNSMPGGGFLGTLFFLLVLFAALTSSISLMEAVVSIIRDRFKTSRKTAGIITLGISVILGIPSSMGHGIWNGVRIIGMNFLDFLDFISNSVIMPIVAFLTCIFIGWVVKPKVVIEEVELNGKFKSKTLFMAVLKYIAPVCIVLILLSSVLEAFGVITL